MAGAVAADRAYGVSSPLKWDRQDVPPAFAAALGEVFDWAVLLGALGLLGWTAWTGLTFMPSAGFLTHRAALLWFERGALAIAAAAACRWLLGGRALPGAALVGLGAVAVLCLFSLAHTTDRYATREEVFLLVALAGLALALLIALTDTVKTHALLAGLAALGLGEAVLGLRQYAGGAPTPAYWLSQAFAGLIRTRVYGTLGSPNVLAGFLLVGIAAALLLALSLRPILRPLPAAALVVLIVALVLTYSRGGYAGLAVLVLAAGILLAPVWRRAWWVLLLMAAVAAGAAVRLPAVAARAGSITPAQEDTGTSRRFIWATARRMGAEAPTWGTGLGTFNAAYSPYRPPGVRETFAMLPIPGSAHDDYLQIFVETGRAGAAVLAAAVLWGLWRSACRYRRGGAGERVWLGAWAAGLLGVATTSLVDENLYVVANLAMLVALSAAVAAHVRRSDRPPLRFGQRLLILPLAVVFAALLPLLAPPVEATALHDRATQLVLAGEFRGAVAAFRQALDADPLNATVPAYFGDLLVDLYDRRFTTTMGPWQTLRTRAAELYDASIRLNRWSAYPRAELGRLRRREGRYGEAAAAFQEAIRLDPYAPRYRLWLGETLLAAGDRTGAAGALREAAAQYPVELLMIEHHEGQGPRYAASREQLAQAERLLRQAATGRR